ncbi:MAG: AmmeMemoRadiSam system protein B, partial [Candidatus Zixiibacteriota bacterium]
YPADKTGLEMTVQAHLDNVRNLPEIDGWIIALIVPHAGLVYSGQIAAYSYKLLENSDVNRVILCGPSHQYWFEGVSVYGQDVVWNTPLGDVPGDSGLCREMLDFSNEIKVIPEAHLKEHCLEVQLPYLQTVLKDFKIVPAIIGLQSASTIKLLGDALTALSLDDHTIMIASTDWQHYRPADEGWKFDSVGIACLEKLDPDQLEKSLENGQVEMCGGGSTVAVIRAAVAHGANRAKILRYGDSGDISGDKNRVVSYVAAVLYQANEKQSEIKTNSDKNEDMKKEFEKYELSDKDKTTLLKIARHAIESYLTTGQIPPFEVAENLQIPGAAFVTLEKDHQLRGCIGHVMAVDPLYRTVATCAVQAAVSDPRFPPVKKSELEELHIEISVLTPQQQVNSLDEIEVGRDGLMISKGRYRGLLLPQVAAEYGWNRTEFLQQTCRKAGLPGDAYKSPEATIYKFQALIFGEEEK